MIGTLPKELIISGVKYKIRTDFRLCLHIMQMFRDKKMSDDNKFYTMIELLYKEIPVNIIESAKRAVLFLNCENGESKFANNVQTELSPTELSPTELSPYNADRLMDWNQDESIIFAGITDVAGRDIRNDKYVHWWTFNGYYMSIHPDSIFCNVISIRRKLMKNQKLEKYEQDYYKSNRKLIDLRADGNDVINNMNMNARMAEFLRTGIKV